MEPPGCHGGCGQTACWPSAPLPKASPWGWCRHSARPVAPLSVGWPKWCGRGWVAQEHTRAGRVPAAGLLRASWRGGLQPRPGSGSHICRGALLAQSLCCPPSFVLGLRSHTSLPGPHILSLGNKCPCRGPPVCCTLLLLSCCSARQLLCSLLAGEELHICAPPPHTPPTTAQFPRVSPSEGQISSCSAALMEFCPLLFGV